MNITRAAIKNNRVTILALLVLLLSGLAAYRNLPRAEDPGFTIRTALVTTYFPGASPERVEQLVTDKLERAIQEMPELDYIGSRSRTGLTRISVNIKESYTDMRPIWDALRRKVERVSTELPDGVIGPFVDDEFGDVYPIMLTVTGDGLSYAELKEVADEVRDQLLRIADVAKVDVYGAQDERVFVEYNNARLAEVGLSPVQLQSILASQNIITPGGSVFTGEEEIPLEPAGSFDSVEDLKRTIIQVPGRTDVIYLEDLAHVYRGYVDPPSAKMHSSGVRSLGLAISMREGGNVVTMGEEVRAAADRFETSYPWGVEFDFVLFQPDAVNDQVNNFVVNLLQAMAVVLVVMVLSLGVRTGLVVATLIPMTMVTTLLLMSVFGIGLDQISIAALIIALGMLVDNAIVISESTMVEMEAGKSSLQAAVHSANEHRIPLLTASLTTAAAFLPIYLAESALGEFCSSLFKVVTIALLSSCALSLTMMPLLCMLFLRVKKQESESFDTPFYRRYRDLLIGMVRRPLATISVVLVVFLLTLGGLSFVPKIFMPKADNPRMLGEVDLPLGTSIDRTEEVTAELERYIADELTVDGDRREGILSWSTYIGSQGGPRYRLAYNPTLAGSEHVSFIITATSRAFVDEAIPRLEEFCWERFPSASSTWTPESMGPAGETTVEVRLFGSDAATLFDIVDDVKAEMRGIPGTRNIQDDWGPRTKKLRVEVNQARARRAGVTSQDVAVSLQTGLSGITITEYRERDEVIPVTLRSVAGDRRDIGKLESLNVFSQLTGRSVPLRQVADIEVVWEASRILRRDRQKAVTVKSYLDPGVSVEAVNEPLASWLETHSGDWPFGYRYEIGGEQEKSDEANASLMAKVPIAGFIILLLLVTQFNSVRRTFIVLFTIPLALIGVTVGLLVMRSSFGFMTLLGIVSLAGIVVNDAIVLLDRIRIEREDNDLTPERAVIESAQRRLRPILLTSATTIGGLLPLLLFGGPMWESMAIAIMFGLLFATGLTLGVIPVMYTLFFRLNFKDFRY